MFRFSFSYFLRNELDRFKEQQEEDDYFNSEDSDDYQPIQSNVDQSMNLLYDSFEDSSSLERLLNEQPQQKLVPYDSSDSDSSEENERKRVMDSEETTKQIKTEE